MGKAFDDADNGLNVKITLPGYPGYSLLRTKGVIGPSIGDGGTIGGGGSVGGKIGDTAGTVIDQIAARNGVIRVGNGFRCPDNRQFGGTFTDAMGTTCGIRLVESAIEGAIGEIEQTVFEALSEAGKIEERIPGNPQIYVPDRPDLYGLDFHSSKFTEARESIEKTYGQVIRGTIISPDDPLIPDVLYHVTTAASKVSEDGILRGKGEGGLGGDARDRIVSMTVDREIAEEILRDMRLMHAVMNTENPDEALAVLKEQSDSLGITFSEKTWDTFRFHAERDGTYAAAMSYFTYRETAAKDQLGRKINNPVFVDMYVNPQRRSKFADIDPNDFQIVEIPRENLSTGALVTSFDVGKDFLEEVRIYGDVQIGSISEPRGAAFVPSPRSASVQVPAVSPADLPKQPRLMVPSREHTPSPLRGGLADLAEEVGDWGKLKEEIDKRGIVFFDYETTGIDSVTGSGGAPVQIGAVRVVDGKVVERLNLYVRPTEPLSDWSKKNLKNADGELLTEEWAAQQMDPAEAHRQLVEFFGDSFIAAHNAPFDFDNVLASQLAEHQIEYTPTGILDTLELARQVIPKGEDGVASHSLGGLMEYFGDKPTGWHTAEADAEDTMKLFNGIFEDAIKRGTSTELLTKKRQTELERERALKVAVDKKNFTEVYQKYRNDREEYEQLRKDNPDLPPLSPEPPLPNWFTPPKEASGAPLPGTSGKITVKPGKNIVPFTTNTAKGRKISDAATLGRGRIGTFETDDLVVPEADNIEDAIKELKKIKPPDDFLKKANRELSQERIDHDVYIRSVGKAIFSEAVDRMDSRFFGDEEATEGLDEIIEERDAFLRDIAEEISKASGFNFSVIDDEELWSYSIVDDDPILQIGISDIDSGVIAYLTIGDFRSNPKVEEGRTYDKIQLSNLSLRQNLEFDGEFQFTQEELRSIAERMMVRLRPKRDEVNGEVNRIWSQLPDIAAGAETSLKKLGEQRRKAVIEVLSELGFVKSSMKGKYKAEVKEGKFKTGTLSEKDHPEYYKSLERALERLEEVYPEQLLTGLTKKPVRIIIDPNTKRASYDDLAHVIVMRPPDDEDYFISTLVHEFGHAIQNIAATPEQRRMIQECQYAFIKSRAESDKLASLKKLFPDSSYKRSERVFEDTFSNAYMGKVYGVSVPGTQRTQDYGLDEVFTMAMEYLSGDKIVAPGDMNTIYWAIGVLFASFDEWK